MCCRDLSHDEVKEWFPFDEDVEDSYMFPGGRPEAMRPLPPFALKTYYEKMFSGAEFEVSCERSACVVEWKRPNS